MSAVNHTAGGLNDLVDDLDRADWTTRDVLLEVSTVEGVTVDHDSDGFGAWRVHPELHDHRVQVKIRDDGRVQVLHPPVVDQLPHCPLPNRVHHVHTRHRLTLARLLVRLRH